MNITKWYMSHIHIATPDAEVIADFTQRAEAARQRGATITDADLTATIADALRYHHENQEFYKQVMS